MYNNIFSAWTYTCIALKILSSQVTLLQTRKKLVEIGDMVTSGAADTGKSELGHGAKR